MNDCRAFARVSGLQLVSIAKEKGVITAVIRKDGATLPAASTATPTSCSRTATTPRNGASIIVFSCEMDKVLAALVLANGACAVSKASGGTAGVTLFFTFWGLNVLKKVCCFENASSPRLMFLFSFLFFFVPSEPCQLTMA